MIWITITSSVVGVALIAFFTWVTCDCIGCCGRDRAVSNEVPGASLNGGANMNSTSLVLRGGYVAPENLTVSENSDAEASTRCVNAKDLYSNGTSNSETFARTLFRLLIVGAVIAALAVLYFL